MTIQKITPESILQQIAAIEHMERGTLCVMRKGPNGAYFNHQWRENGRHFSRYVPADQEPALRENIDAYQRFDALVHEYVRLVSDQSREQRLAGVKKKLPPKSSSSPRKRKSSS
jgi:hypothetical protein